MYNSDVKRRVSETILTPTGEVDGVSHGDDSSKTQHSVKCQDVLNTVLADNHHHVILFNSVTCQATRHMPDSITCLRKRVRFTRQTIYLSHYSSNITHL